jgi:hypothetical protein
MMQSKLFLITVLTAVLIASAAAAYDSNPFHGFGIIRGVASGEMNIVIQNADGFQILVVEHEATIRDAYGASIALRDLPLGSEVEIIGRYWEGLVFALSLRVSSGSVARTP